MAQCQWCHKEMDQLIKQEYCPACESKIKNDILEQKERLESLLSQAAYCTTEQNKDRIMQEVDDCCDYLQKYSSRGVPFLNFDVDTQKAGIRSTLENSLSAGVQAEPARPPLRADTTSIVTTIFLAIGLLGCACAWVVFGFVSAAVCLVSTLLLALFGQFCASVLFYLEKQRNFNKKTIELLERIVSLQDEQPTIPTASQQPAKVAAAE